MLYLLFGSVLCFMLSAVFFKTHRHFRQMCRLDPPEYIYRKNNLELDMKGEILWETPESTLDKNDGSREALQGLLFVLKWGLFAGGWFQIAAFLEQFLPNIMK